MSVNGVSLGTANAAAMESKKVDSKKKTDESPIETPIEAPEVEKQPDAGTADRPEPVTAEVAQANYAPFLGGSSETPDQKPRRDSRVPGPERRDYYDSRSFGRDGVELEANTSGTYEGTDGNDRIESDIISINEGGARMVARGRGGDDEIRLNGRFENFRSDGFDSEPGARADASGGTGNDRVEVEEFRTAFVNGGTGNDDIRVSRAETARVTGGQGNDDISVLGADQAVVSGGDGEDLIRSAGTGSYNLAGNSGDDILNLQNGTLFSNDSKTTVTARGGQGDDVVNISTQDNPESFMDTRFGSGPTGFPRVGPDGRIVTPEPPAFKQEFDRLGFNYRNNTVTVNGGAGQDTVNIEGNREDYTESLDVEGYRRYRNNNSRDVIRVGSDVETVNFVAALEVKSFQELLNVESLLAPRPIPPIFAG